VHNYCMLECNELSTVSPEYLDAIHLCYVIYIRIMIMVLRIIQSYFLMFDAKFPLCAIV